MKKLFFLMAAILLLSMPAGARTLWLVGDGTMAQYTDSVGPCGWVQALDASWKKRTKIINDAEPGMNINAFVHADAYKKIKKKPNGSILLLQVGTNELKEYDKDLYCSVDSLVSQLIAIIDYAHKKKVTVVLCTPMAQPYYYDNQLVDRLGAYPDAIRRVAKLKGVALLDLEKLTREWLSSMTPEEAAAFYITTDKTQLTQGEYQLTAEGAAIVGEMTKQAIFKMPGKKLRKTLKTK